VITNILKYPGSPSTGTLPEMLDPEDDSTRALQNIRNYLPNDTSSHPRRLEASCYCAGKCCKNIIP